ncbi:MAG: THUMP domain-containing protein [Thermoplasmata archaeon]|nr:THUMP domain-containing protein [Thermoplasmata archaeon]
MTPQILVRYGELALKSTPVRREFERTLTRNILAHFLAAGSTCRLRSDRGHLYVEVTEAAPALRILQRVFGVTSVSEVFEVTSEPAAIAARLLELAEPLLRPGVTFAVRARRTGNHPFTSQELARDLGAAVLERWPDRQLKVRLDDPQVELFVEVRSTRTYLSFDRARGPGGLPLGVAGRVVALVDGTRGGLGAYLMMKRGCRCGVVATRDAGSLAEEVLHRFDPSGTVVVEPTAEAAMVSLGRLAEGERVDGVVLPLRVDEYPAARVRWGDRVVFSPTVAFTDEEVTERWNDVVHAAR